MARKVCPNCEKNLVAFLVLRRLCANLVTASFVYDASRALDLFVNVRSVGEKRS